MSLAIDVDKVEAVLMAGEWYEVYDSSFTIDAYEYVWYETKNSPVIEHGGGSGGVCAAGFSFTAVFGADKRGLSGPLTAIQAIQHTL